MYRAGTALSDTTTVLGAYQLHMVPKYPEKRGRWIEVKLALLPVDV
jgi:hypothetical protein